MNLTFQLQAASKIAIHQVPRQRLRQHSLTQHQNVLLPV